MYSQPNFQILEINIIEREVAGKLERQISSLFLMGSDTLKCVATSAASITSQYLHFQCSYKNILEMPRHIYFTVLPLTFWIIQSKLDRIQFRSNGSWYSFQSKGFMMIAASWRPNKSVSIGISKRKQVLSWFTVTQCQEFKTEKFQRNTGTFHTVVLLIHNPSQ